MSNESISSHLLELRSRLIRVIICLGILSIAGIPFASEIYSFVASPLLNILPEGSSMIATQVTSPFMAPIKYPEGRYPEGGYPEGGYPE